MKFVGILLFLAIVACAVYGQQRHTLNRNGNAAGRASLRKHLFRDYDPVNIPDDVVVKFGLSLLALDVNEEKATLEADAWLQYRWTDSRLKWDNVTNGINLIRVSPIEIWKPDITLYNSANLKDMMRCWDSNPVLFATGEVLWVPPCQISSHCNFTLDKYPYGEQNCFVKFGSWTYDSDLLDLELYSEKQAALIDNFGSTEWKIVRNSATRNERHYPCCPEPYTDITFNLTIQRVDYALDGSGDAPSCRV